MKRLFAGTFSFVLIGALILGSDIFLGTGNVYADDGMAPIEVSGNIGVASDLRDRGLSLSGQDFSPTFSLNIDHSSGFYGGVFGATNLETPRGAESEIEFYGGYSFASGAYVIDLSLEVDTFFWGISDRAYAEFKTSVSRDFGLAYIRAGVSYAPDGRWFTPDRDSLYFRTDIEIPVPGVPEATLITRFGYDVRGDRADIADWGVGLSYFLGDVEVSLMFEDSAQDGPFGEANIIGGLRYFF